MEDELVDAARIAKAHLGLGRVHIDVDAGRVEFEEQHIGRVARPCRMSAQAWRAAWVSSLSRTKRPLTKKYCSSRPGARIGRQRGEAGEPQRPGAGIERPGLREEVVADDFAGAMRRSRRWRDGVSGCRCGSAEGDVGRASAMRRSTSSQCAYSVASDLRNLRRAGVL
jgi:hypothetical protein